VSLSPPAARDSFGHPCNECKGWVTSVLAVPKVEQNKVQLARLRTLSFPDIGTANPYDSHHLFTLAKI